MKLPRYVQDSDVNMRLNHSYVRYGGRAAYVHDVSGFTIRVITDPMVDAIKVHVDDPELDISSPPTGYCVTKEKSLWISRMPLRQQKQGLEAHTINGYAEGMNFQAEPVTGLPGVSFCLDMINGFYPTVDQAIRRLANKEVSSIAFRRQFCFSRLTDAKTTFGLKFIGRPIGLFDSDTGTAILSSCYGGSPVAAALAENFHVEVQDEPTA